MFISLLFDESSLPKILRLMVDSDAVTPYSSITTLLISILFANSLVYYFNCQWAGLMSYAFELFSLKLLGLSVPVH